MFMSDVLRLEVTDLTDEYEGIAYRHDGLKIFIKGAFPGDTAEVELYDVRERYAQGRLISIIRTDYPRIESFCSNRCGSCACTELSYESEVRIKEKQLLKLFRNTLGDAFDESLYRGFIAMDHPFAYRNKAVYAVSERKPVYTVGLYRKATHDIIDISRCSLEPEWINRARNIVRDTLNSGEFLTVSSQAVKTLRYIFFRGTEDGDRLAVLVAYDRFSGIELLTEKLNSAGVDNVLLSINDREGNRILGDTMEVLSGSGCITAELMGLKFKVNPYSFLQINPKQTARLYMTAVELLAPEPDDTVLDLYCGIGTISLYLAEKCRKVFGVECVPEAIDNARENALLNGISNVDFRVGLVEEVLPEILAEGHRVSRAVLDPARKGCDSSVFKALSDAGINTIAYVSCNPKNQCRDILVARNYGYDVKSVYAVDMFPHTSATESIVLLSR